MHLLQRNLPLPHQRSPHSQKRSASVSVSFLRAGVFDAQYLITIPRAKLIRSLGTLSTAQFAVVERAVRLWLGIPAA